MSDTTLSDKLLERLSRASAKLSLSNYLDLDPNTSVVVQILPGEFGPDQLFYLKVGTHYLNSKPIVCAWATAEKPCIICQQIEQITADIKAKEVDVVALKASKGNPEKIKEYENEIAAYEKIIDEISNRNKHCFNVLVKGEEISRIHRAPWSIFKDVFRQFRDNYEENRINILDPLKSYPFKLERVGSKFNDTRYTATIQVNARPLVTFSSGHAKVGQADQESIDKILSTAVNLDQKFPIPSETDQRNAWENYLRGDGDSKPAVQTTSTSTISTPTPANISTPTPVTTSHPVIQPVTETPKLDPATVVGKAAEIKTETPPAASEQAQSLAERLRNRRPAA